MALHPKTLLLLHSGEIKSLDQISEGELLMGSDSTPRRVQKIKPTDLIETVEITPRQNRGAAIIASWDQILVLSKAKFLKKPYGLKLLSGEVRWKNRYPSWKGRNQVAVADILGKTYLGFWKNFKLVKVPLDFNGETLVDAGEKRLEPYFLGLWLGDGTSCRPEITSMDPEVIEYLGDFAKRWGGRLRTSEKKNNKAFSLDLTFSNVKGGPWKGRNKIMSALLASHLIENKHIPDSYLFATREERLQLLAGILDTDGHLQGKVFTIIQKNELLARQIKFVADSLGFRATVRTKRKYIKGRNFNGTYYEVSISGELHLIPTIIPRKRTSPASARYDRKEIGFTVKKIGECNLIEIEVEGDGIFLLSDCTLIGGRREDTRKSTTNSVVEQDKRWGKSFAKVKAYKKKYGSLPSNRHQTENSSQMIQWISNQRAGIVRKAISREREMLLKEIGITAKVLDQNFDRNFQHMVDYRKTYPSQWPKHKEEFPKGNPLGEWCKTIRKLCKKGSLNIDRQHRLTSIGFPWKVLSYRFENNLNLLKGFIQLNSRPPKQKESFRGARLGKWYSKNATVIPGFERSRLNLLMAKPKTRRMSEAEAEQIRASRNLNRKDEEAKAKVSTPQFRAFYDSLPKQRKSTRKKK
jgi:hypothetical protein